MSIFSSCVLSLCAGDERNGHKATWEHLLRVTINIPLTLFIFFSTFTPQQLWEHLLRVTINIPLALLTFFSTFTPQQVFFYFHTLTSLSSFTFTFTPQQVSFMLLLLLHWTKFIKLTWSGGRVSTEKKKRRPSPPFLLRTLLKQVREGRWLNSSNQI